MGIYFGWLSGLSLIVAVLLFCWYIYFKRVTSKFWAKRNVPHLDPVFILGNSWRGNFMENMGITLADQHLKYKKRKILGTWLFGKPVLLPMDHEIIKNILVRDFDHFHDRGFEVDVEREPLLEHLFSMKGSKWRNMRVKITPTFTSGKMKMMFPMIVQCGEVLQTHLNQRKDVEEPIEIKDLLARFTTDTIASCAFGIETNSIKNPDSEFRKFGTKIFKPSVYQIIITILGFVMPSVTKFFGLRQLAKDASDFFLNTVKETINFRESQGVVRNDFMQLLIRLKNKGTIEDVDAKVTNSESVSEQKFTINNAAAQALIFFSAGFETSSTTMTFAFYELALNPEMQRRLQQEIDRVLEKFDNKITYDGIGEMEYLDWFVQETLRKYPPVTMLFRTCTKDYEISEMNASIQKGTSIMISVLGLQRDPYDFPNPEKFDPERFSPKEKSKRKHFTNLPFGEGPRNCIGNRFGLLLTKVGIVAILSKFEVHISEKTAVPLEYDIKSFVLTPVGGMPLRILPRS